MDGRTHFSIREALGHGNPQQRGRCLTAELGRNAHRGRLYEASRCSTCSACGGTVAGYGATTNLQHARKSS
ncbi:hypothetical protein GOP47_0006091 [Adiantum capillus-veneris]|uniref:Uncharacterized protein n=1 Tax=Adiantum capillus-veneris TaxID=13818 RepID=A0A9D4V273_ADICA|nr:hypothetical protein GOP47_0006091 [Adiantum capillus-veneris]